MKRLLAAPFVLTAALAHADKLPVSEHPERVHKGTDGRCIEYPDASCPPGVHCNPGPPHEVKCPPEDKKDKPSK